MAVKTPPRYIADDLNEFVGPTVAITTAGRVSVDASVAHMFERPTVDQALPIFVVSDLRPLEGVKYDMI